MKIKTKQNQIDKNFFLFIIQNLQFLKEKETRYNSRVNFILEVYG